MTSVMTSVTIDDVSNDVQKLDSQDEDTSSKKRSIAWWRRMDIFGGWRVEGMGEGILKCLAIY